MTPPCVVCGKPGGYRVKLQRHPTGQLFSGWPLCWRHVREIEPLIKQAVADLKSSVGQESQS